MPIYALRWPDRSVSITCASSEDMAVLNFDAVADPSDLPIVELDSLPLITLQLDSKNDFQLGGEWGPSGGLWVELMEKCFADLN